MPVITSNHHHNSKEGVLMIINTNMGSATAARILGQSTNALQKSLKRLSTGSKITSAADDAAGLAVATRLSANVTALKVSQSNVGNAISFSQTQDGYLDKVSSALERMGELAMLSMDATKSDTDRGLYNKEYAELAKFIDDVGGKQFNGEGLFDASAITISVGLSDSTGGAVSYAMGNVDLGGANYAQLGHATNMTYAISNMISASAALLEIRDAQDQLAEDRATVGANLSRLEIERDSIAILRDNLAAARSRIIDVDVAEESANFAKQQILVQSGTAMLAQANILPQSALRLIS
jgi:flagellin